MYKVYKIRDKKSGLFYKTIKYGYYNHETRKSDAELRTTYFEKSKSYTSKRGAKVAYSRIINSGAAVKDDLGNTLFDKPTIEIVEFNLVEVRNDTTT